MEIKNKYGLGDIVWGIFNEDMVRQPYWRVFDFEVRSVRINHDNKIIYGNYFGFEVFEENCFLTKQEAIDECNKRNKGE